MRISQVNIQCTSSVLQASDIDSKVQAHGQKSTFSRMVSNLDDCLQHLTMHTNAQKGQLFQLERDASNMNKAYLEDKAKVDEQLS